MIANEKRYVGKEANELEQVETGLIDELEAVQMVYRRDRSEEFREQLRGMSVKEAMALTGLSRRQVFYLRSGRRKLAAQVPTRDYSRGTARVQSVS